MASTNRRRSPATLDAIGAAIDADAWPRPTEFAATDSAAVLKRLRDETRETIHFSVRDGDRMTLVDRCDSPQVLRTGWPLGSSSPLHIGATGKAVPATFGESELKRYMLAGLTAWTECSIVDPTELRDDLLMVR